MIKYSNDLRIVQRQKQAISRQKQAVIQRM